MTFDYEAFYNKLTIKDRIPADAKRRFNKIIPLIDKKSKTLLDVGCSDGRFIASLLNRRKNQFNLIRGLDLHKKSLEIARNSGFPDYVEFVEQNVSSLNYFDAFDTVIAQEIAEHLENFEQAIKHWYKIAKKELIVTVPYNESVRKALCIHCHKRTPVIPHLQEKLTEDVFKEILPEDNIEFHYLRKRRWLSKEGNPNPILRVFRSILLILFFPKPEIRILIVQAKKN